MGLRIQIHRDRDKVIIFSDSGFKITDRFPLKVRALKAIKDPYLFILDSEIEMWIKGKHQPREVSAGYIGAKTPPDDSNFIFNIFGCLAYGGSAPRNLVEEAEFFRQKGRDAWIETYMNRWPPEFSRERTEVEYRDMHDFPYQLRRKFVMILPFPQSTIGVPDVTKHFNIAPSFRVDNLKDAKKILIKCSDSPASEGAMVKQAEARYPLNNLTTDIQKLKIYAEVHGIVWKVNKTKTPGIFTVDYALAIDPGLKVPEKEIVTIAGKEYVNAGRTFPTKSKPKIGDVITVRFHTLNVYEDPETGLIDIEVYEPALTEIRGPKEKPDSIKSAIKIAEDAQLIGRKPLKAEHGELEWIEDIEKYRPMGLAEKQLADDFRIVNAWYATWKDPTKKIKFTKEQIVDTAIKIAKEIVRRVKAGKMRHTFKYWAMTDTSKELFKLIYKKAGIPDEMIEWEKPVGRSDIDVVVERQEEFLEHYPEDQKYRRVIQTHFRGKSAHWDMRFEAGVRKDFLIGFTLFTMIRGKIKKPVLDMKTARKLSKDPDIWKINPVTGEFKKRVTRAGAIKEVSVMARMKAAEPCLVKGSLIWTSNGLKPIERIKVGEEVLDGNGKWTKVIANEKINLESSILKKMKVKYGIDTIYTPYHPVLTKEGYINIADLTDGEMVLFPRINFNETIKELVYQQFDQCGLYCSFKHLEFDYSLGYLLGVFAGDGNFISTGLSFSISRGKERLESVLDKLNLRHSKFFKVSDGNYWKIEIYDEKFMYLIKSLMLGGSADQFTKFKFLPPGLLTRTNHEFVKGYIEGFLDADGHFTRRGLFLSQSNIFSLSSFIFANILVGNLVNFTKSNYYKFGKARTQYKTSKLDKSKWVDQFYGEHWALPIKELRDVSGRKKVRSGEQLYKYVYNLQTESSTFCTMNVATHNTEWLTYQGVRPAGEITATKLYPGVMVIIDGPENTRTQYLAQTTRLHEYWFSGGIFKGPSEGRYIFRIMVGMFRMDNYERSDFSLEDDGDLWFVETDHGLDIYLSNGSLPEKAEDIRLFEPEMSPDNIEIWRSLEERIAQMKVPKIKGNGFEILLQKRELLPPGEEEEIPGPAWLLIHTLDPVPYVISGRAESLEWMPPLGISALPEHVRKQIPPELRYWKKEIHQGKLNKADKIRRQIVDEIKKKELKLEFWRQTDIQRRVGAGRFTLQYQTWKGPSPVRLGPSRFEYNIRIRVRGENMVVHCFNDPTKKRPVAATYEIADKDWRDIEGAVEPGHPLNPTKATPSFIEIIDKGDVVVLEDLRDWKKFEFRGKILKGLFVMDREKGMPIWEFRVSKGPEERV